MSAKTLKLVKFNGGDQIIIVCLHHFRLVKLSGFSGLQEVAKSKGPILEVYLKQSCKILKGSSISSNGM